MKSLFEPDYVFPAYAAITPEFLKSLGICAVISDIDNTLAPYEQPEPDEALLAWYRSLTDAGIRIAFLSNNNSERVELFNKKTGFAAFPDSHKPSVKKLKAALKATYSSKETAVCLGDQLFTDVWTAHRYGMRCILVPPIRDKNNFFFRLKRRLECPVMKKLKRKNPGRVPELPAGNPWFS